MNPEIRTTKHKKIAIIGGGSSSLLCAYFLSDKFDVRIYEKGTAIGKKYLVAGKGGFNLAHSCTVDELTTYYSPAGFLNEASNSFPPEKLRKWYSDLGIPTFVGSSNRVFPNKGITPATVLRTIKKELITKGVKIHPKHAFVGFSPNHNPLIQNPNGTEEIQADHFVFALGGASWPITGSDGHWLEHFDLLGISTNPFQSANCGLNLKWPEEILQFHTGKPLKNITIRFGDEIQKGEALITEYGLEGNAVYPLASTIGKHLSQNGSSTIYIDLKPHSTAENLISKIENSTSSGFAKKLNLPTHFTALLKMASTQELYQNPLTFVELVKNVPLNIQSLRPIEEAISTTGGISTAELNRDFSLTKYPHLSCIGEMVDWEAPTGGFLLQACFSMAFFKAQALLKSDKMQNEQG